MTVYDYTVLGFYFAFMVAISWVFRRFVHNVSDYFRGGGKALWWMVGGSAFMVSFSAWTFTGAAGRAYVDGWPILAIYLGNVLGFLLNACHFAPKFRQLRVVTSVEAIRQRFGRANEQVFTWLKIPLGTLQASIWLYALGIFFSAVFGVDLTLTIVVTGLVVLLIALLGGSWSVLASDFIQMLILMPVCLAVTVLAVAQVGGPGAFLHRLPAGHLDLRQLWSKDFLGLWCFAMVLKQITSTNNLFEASRYLSVKDSRHARRAAYLGAGLYLTGAVVWFVPPTAAAILFPDLHAMFPALAYPEEAAFIAIARVVMPVGMLGLLVSGIFAATISAMDAGLNRSAGIFVKNFYQPVVRPAGQDAHLLKVGKLATLTLGVIVIVVALQMSQLENRGLFILMQQVSILVSTPILLPLLLGLLVKRTPPWSAWSTVLVGFAGSLVFCRYLTPAWAAQTFGADAAGNKFYWIYWTQGIQFLGNVSVGTLWFLGTTLFWKRTAPAHQQEVEVFIARLDTPVDFAREEGAANANDARQSAAIGWLCLAYSAFVLLLTLIPNSLVGRLAFVFCGGLVGVIGAILLRAARQNPPPPPEPSAPH